jgi:MFS family permease
MFLLYFVNAFQSSITSNLSAFVVSGFEAHSLIPVISIVSNVMSAATYMPLAKLLNLWDRSVGFAVMAAIATLGLILSATCTDVATYCASQVFYSVGFVGVIFSIDVITADTSSLRDRGLAYAFTSSPYIITAFAGPKAAEGFYDDNWRWGFGTFAIVLPVVAAPLFLTLQYNKRKAIRNGLLVKQKSDRPLMQSIWHYVIEFDGESAIHQS